MKTLLITAGFCLLLSACSSTKTEPVATAVTNQTTTTTTTSTTTTTAPQVAQVSPKLICQTEFTIGSRFPKKVCRTSEQIEEQKKQSQKTMDTLRYTAPGGLSQNGNG